MKTKVEYNTGFTLTYEGVKFTENGIQYSDNELSKIVVNGNEIPPKTFQFCEDFNNVGALIMRFHFGQSQRSGSLTQIVRSNYGDYALEKVAKGNDQTDFFDVPESAPQAVKDNLKLQQLSSYPLGEAKILNRLKQAIQEKNAMISGEQGLFGTIHAAVWQPVISLSAHLGKSGFMYIPCLPDMSLEQYTEISKALREGRFSFNEENTKIIVNDRTFDLTAPSNIKIHPQETEGFTFQENGLLINQKDSSNRAPLGWMVHVPSKKVLAQADTEDLIRLIRLAEGKFHQLNPFQQKVLMTGRLGDNDRVRFSQNRQLNAMLSIFATLENEFDFDPAPLISNVMKQISKATKKSIEETSVLDDFLTGIVQTAMIQHLVVTKEKSARTELPRAVNLNFKGIENNAKALAYAFDMKDGNGTPVLQNEHADDPFYIDSELPDLGVNGKLLTPSLTDSRHSAAILSTAILVAEQMILEQLLAAHFQKEGNKEYTSALKSFLEMCLGDKIAGEEAYNHLIQLAQEGTRLGLQYEDSAELINALRTYIGTDQLINLVTLLGTEEFSTPEKILEQIPSHAKEAYIKSLGNLHLICAGLQAISGISAASIGSEGAVMGTSLVITKLFPELAKTLKIVESQTAVLPSQMEGEIVTASRTSRLAACPYLKAKARAYNSPGKKNGFFAESSDKKETASRSNPKAEITSTPDSSQTDNKKSSTWSSFFAKVAVTTVGIGGTLLAATSYLSNN